MLQPLESVENDGSEYRIFISRSTRALLPGSQYLYWATRVGKRHGNGSATVCMKPFFNAWIRHGFPDIHTQYRQVFGIESEGQSRGRTCFTVSYVSLTPTIASSAASSASIGPVSYVLAHPFIDAM
jgi:hypothetical protein